MLHTSLSYTRTRTQNLLRKLAGIVVLIFSLGLIHYKTSTSERIYQVTQEKGRAELQFNPKDFTDHQLYFLKTDAEFYWKQLLYPEDFHGTQKPPPDSFQSLAGKWNNYINNHTGDGYATYRLVMHVPNNKTYGLKVSEMNSAYNLWVNNQEIISGTVGTTKETTIPSYKRKELYVSPKDGKLELILQIANFHHRRGGPIDMIIFGLEKDIKQMKSATIYEGVFLIGMVSVLLIFLTALYCFGLRDRSLLYFSSIGLGVVVRIVLTGEKMLFDFFPDFNWTLAIRLEYISILVLVPTTLAFIHEFIPPLLKKWMIKTINLLFSIMIGIVFTTDVKTFTILPEAIKLFIILLTFYLFILMVRAVVKKVEHADLFIFGFFILLITIINDLILFNSTIRSLLLFSYGYLSILLCFSIAIAQKMADALRNEKRYREELEQVNMDLEKTIKERTFKIASQKKILEEQALDLQQSNTNLKELSKFKEEMSQMVVHDLKNPLLAIISLAKMSPLQDRMELIQQSGYDMLNLIMNLLDIGKYESTEMILDKQPIETNVFINKACEEVKIKAELKEVDLINVQAKHNRFEINMDNAIMTRVIVNILDNAIKYTPKGTSITISTEKLDNSVVFKMKNQGPVITELQAKKIFKQYESGRADRNSIGLGLTFCKMAVESHGGKIGVTPYLEEGAEFFFSIPMMN